MNDLNYQYSPYDMDEVIKAHKINKEKRELRGRSISTGLLCTICILIFSVLAFILIRLMSGALSGTPMLTDSRLSLIPDMLLNGVVSLIGFGLVGMLFCKVTKTDYNEILPHKSISFKKLAAVIAIGFTVCICANYIAQMFLIDLSIFGVEPVYDASQTGSTSLIEHIVYIIAVSVVPAVSEEFIFRGCVMGRLRKFGDGFALIASSALFGLMHGNFTQAVFAFVVGLAAGWAVIYTGSIFPAMLIHFFNNFLSVMADISYENLGDFGINTTIVDIVYMGVYAAIFALAIAAVYMLAKKDKNFLKFKPYEGELSFKERIKIFATSFTVIIFTALMLLECFMTLQVIE